MEHLERTEVVVRLGLRELMVLQEQLAHRVQLVRMVLREHLQ
jgi:hypothetical protein